MIWSSCSVLWICTNILVSRPISQRREDWSGLPEFPHLLGAAVVPRCGSTERQEASVHCCCYWEAGCWTSRANLPAWRLLQLLFHCAQHRAHSVEQQWWAEATMLHSHMDRHTQIWECHAFFHCNTTSALLPFFSHQTKLSTWDGLCGCHYIHYLDYSSYYCLNCLTAHFIWGMAGGLNLVRQ